jgi:hypothetical protein
VISHFRVSLLFTYCLRKNSRDTGKGYKKLWYKIEKSIWIPYTRKYVCVKHVNSRETQKWLITLPVRLTWPLPACTSIASDDSSRAYGADRRLYFVVYGISVLQCLKLYLDAEFFKNICHEISTSTWSRYEHWFFRIAARVAIH